MPKKKLTLDFVVNLSPPILYNHLSTSDGLARWFADEVYPTKDGFSFVWEGEEENATIIGKEQNSFIKIKMENSEEGEYLEMRIKKSEVTDDTILIITDFAEDYDMEDQKRLWISQVDVLVSNMGGGY